MEIQWAIKELATLKEEHENLGARIARLESELQLQDPLGHSYAGHPSVPPLNTARNKEFTGKTTAQSSPPTALPAKSRSRTPSDKSSSDGAEARTEARTASEQRGDNAPAPPAVITRQDEALELSSNVKSLAQIHTTVHIGLLAKTATAMRHSREEPAVVLMVQSGKYHWFVSKSIAQLKSLDQAIRSPQLVLPQLPDKSSWSSFSPVKIDVRIDILNSYFSHAHELVLSLIPKAQEAYAKFLASDLVEINDTVQCSFLVCKSRFSGWKPRFCVLNGSHIDMVDKPGGSVIQSINLARARVSAITDNVTASDDEYRHGLSVVEPKENSSKSTIHFFSAESQQVRANWLAAIQNLTTQAPLPGVNGIFPFRAIRERPSLSVSENASTLTSSGSERQDLNSLAHGPSSQSPDPKSGRRKSSLTLEFPPQSPFFDTGMPTPRISSPQSAIAITHHNSGPTSAFAQRRVISPTSFSHSPHSHSSGAGNNMISSPRSNVFRVSLDDALGYSSVSLGPAVVPTIVGRCLEFLYQKVAYLEEGLFRISGTQSQVDNLEVRFERDDVDIDDLARNKYDVHVVASVLKRYFRLLPEPLIPNHDEQFWRNVMEQEWETRNTMLREVVTSLPRTCYDVLDVMTQFLGQVHRNSDVNKMTPQNLGIVFSPTLGIPGPVIIGLIEDQSKIFAG